MDLRHSNYVLSKVAEHLVRLAGDFVTLHTASAAKKEQRAFFLIDCERTLLAASVSIYRRIGEDQRELEFGDRFAEHIKGDRRAVLNFRKNFAEKFPIRGNCV